MLMLVVIIFILNIIFTWSVVDNSKYNENWLKNAQKEWVNDKGLKSEYEKSEIFIKKNSYKYLNPYYFIISIWIILIIFPFFFETKEIIAIYAINYMYFRITNWLGLIELKTDSIRKEIYEENEYL